MTVLAVVVLIVTATQSKVPRIELVRSAYCSLLPADCRPQRKRDGSSLPAAGTVLIFHSGAVGVVVTAAATAMTSTVVCFRCLAGCLHPSMTAAAAVVGCFS